MNVKVIKSDKLVGLTWRGGKSYQYYIYPQNKLYEDHDFIFRISCATIELEQSNFTQFKGYTRYLVMLDNRLNVLINNEEIMVKKYEPIIFNSNDEVVSFSQGSDLNIFIREDIKKHNLLISNGLFTTCSQFTVVFCLSKALVTINNKTYELKRHDALIIENEKLEEITYQVDQECIITSIL
ncbi:MAG: HutD family protein [Bacilli bacterium]